jgi:putative DNA primase/helicase
VFPGGGVITPQAAILALIRRLNQDSPDGDNDTPDAGSKPVEDKDKARFARVIRDLLKLAFDASATPQECKAYLNKAADLARKYGLSWPDPGAAETAAAPGPREEGELLPEPANPLAVARVVQAEWTDAAGNLTLRRWNGDWYQHDGSRWSESEDEAIFRWFYRRLEHAVYVDTRTLLLLPWSPTKGKIAAVLDAFGMGLALVERGQVPPCWLDDGDRPDPRGIVAVANGLLEIGQGKLHPPTAAYFNQVACPFEFDPDAPAPRRWAQFLRELWPSDPDSIALLAEWFGYVLSGRTDLHKILGLFGPPRSGKGTLARMLQELAGVANTVGPTMAQLAAQFGMQPLPGKTLAVISDARLAKGKRMMVNHVAVERLLAATGEDRITIDRKYKAPWTGTLSARFMVLANEAPLFADASGAIVTRFVVLRTTRSFLGKEDPALTEQLKSELPGVLNWALGGLKRLDANGGKFSKPESASVLLDDMREGASPETAFLEDRCEKDPEGRVPRKTLFSEWRTWCKETGNAPGTINEFGTGIRAAWPCIGDARPVVDGERTRFYTGISLQKAPSKRGRARSG